MASTKVSAQMNYGTATASGTVALILDVRPSRSSVVIQNNHASNDLYIGSDGSLTTSNGLHLKAGASITFDDYVGEIWGIASASSTDVRYIEVY